MSISRCAMLVLLAGCKSPSPAPTAPAPPPAAPKCVPKVLVAHQGTPALDGALDEPVWHAAAATEPFVSDTVKRVVPHTEARAAWDAEALYVALYVADAELLSSDRVTAAFEPQGTVEVSPDGAARCRFGAQTDCAGAGVVTKLERDGDVDAAKEEDEEWAVELKLPWKLLAPAGRPTELPVGFSRVDTLEGERIGEVWSRRCGVLRLE